MESESEGMYSVGVDVGGTNTELALVNEHGKLLRHDSFSTVCPSFDDWAERLALRIQGLIGDIRRDKIWGIGIGAPAANTESGTVEGATNLNWPSTTPLADEIGRRIQLRTVIANDANAAAMGEMKYGAARGLRNFIVLTLGTGVGAGVVVDGHLLTGTHGFAAELGHVQFGFIGDRVCSCGRKGCLETVASAKGIIRTALNLLNAEPDRKSSLRDIPHDKLAPDNIAQCAYNGDELALEVYKYTGECIGRASASFAAFADPEAIILFGGIARAGDLMIPHARRVFDEECLHLYRDKVSFAVSTIAENEAALLGAASLPIK